MNAHVTRTEPIACTLGAGAYRERLAWLAELNQSALRHVLREGTQLILCYDLQAAGDVREMVRREQECCAFLDFTLVENERELTLAITAPEAAREALDTVFDPFLTGSKTSGGGCICTTAASR